MKKVVLGTALVAIVGSMASAQTPQFITIGPHTTVYTGFTRGFSYTAPIDHTIIRLELPEESFVTGALASYVIDVNPGGGGEPDYYTWGNAGAVSIPFGGIDVFVGDLVIILGNWTDGAPGSFTARNSYASGGPDPQFVLGEDVLLYRAGFQSDIANPGSYTSGAGFHTLNGSYGRIWVTVIPAPASLALLGLGGLVAVRRRR